MGNYWNETYARFLLSLPIIVSSAGLGLCLLSLYIVLFTIYWYIPLQYLVWIFTIDKHAGETGGRGYSWLYKNLPLPKLPFSFRKSSSYNLDCNKNYLFCCFPHGVYPLGVLFALSFEKGGFKDVFPSHRPYISTLHVGYVFPFVRELFLSFNYVSASEKSLTYLLNDRRGGNAVALIVGGVDEMQYVTKKDYHIFLKRRRGYAKIALKTGAPLVPVFSFGTIDLYKHPKGQFSQRVLDWIETILGSRTILYYGQGIFHNWFGFAPWITPITTIVGEPIEVVKNENPTKDDIEELHTKFTEAIIKLFNNHKEKYLPNGESVKLVVE